ncbi:MAG: ATP-binding protein [Acidobacteria bacterium]|nr:ATP-binding protein [Acidobacteriota bacterium]
MKAVQPIIQAYNEGHAAQLLTGRSLYDLAVDGEGKIRPLHEILRRTLLAQHGMLFVSYSLANGLDFDASQINDERDRRQIETILKANRLHDIPQDQNEVVRVIRGVSSLSRTPTEGLKWADGKDMRFAFCFEFTEHLAPGSLTNGTQSDAQLVAIELAHTTSQSLALRASGNLILFHGRDGLVDELVGGALKLVHLPQPDGEEKREFVKAALALYTGASFEDGVTPEAVANLTLNTPNRGLEALLRASHRASRPVTARELAAQKNRDVEAVSEGTLTTLDTTRVEDLRLCGMNIAPARWFLQRCAQGLLKGAPNTPLNVLLAGPVGTGKTDLAIETAHLGKVAAYQLHSPKGGIVGETERKTRLQWHALNEWGGVAFVDEITEALPLERSDFDGDSGASRAVAAALLTELSNESVRGKRLLVATTNCPWRMSAAMRSRLVIIPVLHPLEQDFAEIVVVTARRIEHSFSLSPADPRIQESARIFYAKGASPRHIRAQLSNALLLRGELTAEVILDAARDLRTGPDEASRIYAELWAIKTCTSRSFLPWHTDPSAYPYPVHIREIVDRATGNVLEGELDRKIAELKPYANV